MSRNHLNTFFISIVFPAILAITLFLLTIFTLILPSFERNIMDRKKEMISELTNTAWSLLEEYNQEYINGTLSLEEAQKITAERVKQIRYGTERKDYFWIINEHPQMIMHPYKNELNTTDLTNYQDPNGKKLFIEATKVVSEAGEGFIDYMWQWKDDSTKIVPKLSYVKGFEPWGWIIGTGIYLEDVKQEIRVLKAKLLRSSFIIALIIIVIILFIIRQSLNIEQKRNTAEEALLLSRQKYKLLVNASTEGTLMLLNHKVIFSNIKFSKLIGYEPFEILDLQFEDIFKTNWEALVSSFIDPDKSVSLETGLKCKNNNEKEVIISISKINYGKDTGYVIITKEVTKQKMLEKETEHLSQELQTSLLLMNQPIRCFVNDIIKAGMEIPIRDAAQQMVRKRRDCIFIHNKGEIIGVINNSDIMHRVVAPNLSTEKSVTEIMTSPVISISENALLYEAVLLLKNKNISHLAVKNIDNDLYGVIGYNDISKMQENTVSYLIKEIEIAEHTEQLQKTHTKLPVLVNALIESGDKTQNITRIITSVTDAITRQLIGLAIEVLGEPPCEFAFIVVGSEGRQEQTLSTDQDNAIVFDDIEPDKLDVAYGYFQKLGKLVCQNLSIVGYKLCDGNNMAKNPKWTQPVSVWKEYFSNWINTSDPQSILDTCIFFDFRSVYGKDSLIKDLHLHVNNVVDNKSVFFYHLAQSVIKFKAPVNLFGNIVGDNQSINSNYLDIKKILIPIVGFIRLYTIFNKLNETNSLKRVKQLYSMKIINKEMYQELVLSYNYLMQIRFRVQSKSILKNEPPDNIVDVNKLTHIEIATLKKIFSEINNLQLKTNFDFKGVM